MILNLLAAAALAATAPQAGTGAPESAQASPEHLKVVLDNEKIRVTKFEAEAGTEIPMHHHPDHVVYPLQDCTVTLGSAAGKTEKAELKTGQALWLEETDHTTKVGDKKCDALIIELKPPLDAEPPRQ